MGPVYAARLPPRRSGDVPDVIGVALALVVLGIVFLFVIPWVGIPVGIVGLVLLGVWLAGFGRRAASRTQP
jgi:hypothetical protein